MELPAGEYAGRMPAELSGGQQQRVGIARALAAQPEVRLADEPTSMLDVSVRMGILHLLRSLRDERGLAILLITHDLGVVARMADDALVMYAGQVVESGSVDDIFYRSAHPYTLGLRRAMPSNDPNGDHVLEAIDGSPPDLFHPPPGCGYFARCPHAMRICEDNPPPRFAAADHAATCWLHHPGAPGAETPIEVLG